MIPRRRGQRSLVASLLGLMILIPVLIIIGIILFVERLVRPNPGLVSNSTSGRARRRGRYLFGGLE